MAWEQVQISIGEATVMGNINTSGEKTRIETPYNGQKHLEKPLVF